MTQPPDTLDSLKVKNDGLSDSSPCSTIKNQGDGCQQQEKTENRNRLPFEHGPMFFGTKPYEFHQLLIDQLIRPDKIRWINKDLITGPRSSIPRKLFDFIL